MNVGTVGTLYGVVTLLVMFSGMPIAFSLGLVAAVFMYFFMPASALDTVKQKVF
jgi:C4-dicarboxylate transporter DctM subunit